MKFEYQTDPDQDDLAPGETRLDGVEVHRVVEEREDEVITVRDDNDSDQLYAWPPIDPDNSRITVLTDS